MKTRTRGSVRTALILWITLAVIVIGVVVMALLAPPAEEAVEEDLIRMPVVTETITPRGVRDRLVLPGTIEAAKDVALAPQKGGVVKEILVKKGDTVRTGQELLRLDARVWENMLKQAAIELREAEKDENRWRELIESGAVSTSDFDAIQTRRELAEVALAQAEVNVSHCIVSSSIDGVVDARAVEVGEHVAEGVPVLRVVSMDPVKVAIAVPEQDVLTVKPGAIVPFSVGALNGEMFEGTVTFVASSAEAAGSSFRTELEVPNPDGRLRPGMMVDVDLVRSVREGVVVVPLNAVIPQKGEHVVYRIESGHAVRCVVRIASITGHEAVLESGLNAGDEIVVEGHRALRDGVQVEIKSAD